MAQNIHVTRSSRDNNMGMLRKFRSLVRGWKGINALRSRKYHTDEESDFMRKRQRLRALTKKEERTKLYKEGKIDRI